MALHEKVQTACISLHEWRCTRRVGRRHQQWTFGSIPQHRSGHGSHVGDLPAHVQALLQMESVKDTEFEPEVLACLPTRPWSISEAEISMRRDLRCSRWSHCQAQHASQALHFLLMPLLGGYCLSTTADAASQAAATFSGRLQDPESHGCSTSTACLILLAPPHRLAEQASIGLSGIPLQETCGTAPMRADMEIVMLCIHSAHT